jgi:hypothetical protein
MICFLDSTAAMVPKYTGIGLESNELLPRLLKGTRSIACVGL